MELAKIAAVIATLDETDGSPESMLYIFFDMDMTTYQNVRNVLLDSELIVIKGNYVTLTQKGKELAQKLNKAITPSAE